MYHIFKKSYLYIYRSLGFAFLGGTLFTLAFYAFLMVFFFFNSTWIAPTVLSPTSDKMLTFSAGYQHSMQNFATLQATESQAVRDKELAQATNVILKNLIDKVVIYDFRTTTLASNKQKNISESTKLLNSLTDTRKTTEASLKAGLITSDEATKILTTIQQFKNSVTDSSISLGTTNITLETQIMQLRQQLAQSENDEKSKEDALKAIRLSLAIAREELIRLKDTPYYKAIRNGANLAFVPYENIDSIKIGASIYDCLAMIVICRKVGTVSTIYKDEQIIDFPLFNIRFSRTVRGILVDMDIHVPSSMSSTIMFAGSKPLFI